MLSLCLIHFRFPFSRPHILNQWVAAVKREKWTPTKNSFLCSEHFTKESYEAQLSSGRWYLKEDAVPELFNYPERLHTVIKRRKPLIRNSSVVPEKKLRTTQVSVELHSNSNHENDANSSDTLTLSSVRPSTTAPESPKKQVLKRKVKPLQQKLRRKNVRITTMKELLKELKSKTNTTPEVNGLLQNYFSEFPLELLQNELKNKDVKKNGARYTEAIKQFSLTLYFYSPKAYRC
ncbi:THAP domain-containing protein 1-like [Periplaneta americana]|uniref:THAP domain-containing protein 1-like n=1 Tax=Periplaneta americana TaxID=6978 RepID=UPI0037E85F21